MHMPMLWVMTWVASYSTCLLIYYAQARIDRSPLVEDDPPEGGVDRFGDHEFSDAFIALLRGAQLQLRAKRLQNNGLVARRSAAAANSTQAVEGAVAAAGGAAAAATTAAATAAAAAGVDEDGATAGSDAEDEPEPNGRVAGGDEGAGDEQPPQHERGGPGAEDVGEVGGASQLSLGKLKFDGPGGPSVHAAGPQDGGGSCKLELSVGKVNNVISMTFTVTYLKLQQPAPEPPRDAAAEQPPAKRKAKQKKDEEDQSRALQCRLSVFGVLSVARLADGLVMNLCMQLPLAQTRCGK